MIQSEIQRFVMERQIPYLLHFTRTSNLPSILQRGIYPIARAHEIKVMPAINDQIRLDGHKDGISLSIGFPNSRMFYKYRVDPQNVSVDWVILGINPSVLWLKDCAFCKHNAADARISSQPIASLKTMAALASMYDEIQGLPSRDDQKLKVSDPTDVQAEVLVMDIIEPQFIFGLVFEKATVRDLYAPLLGERTNFLHLGGKGFFASRGYARAYQPHI